MIPNFIPADHVRQAAKAIHLKGFPPKREATRFVVEVDGKRFPP